MYCNPDGTNSFEYTRCRAKVQKLAKVVDEMSGSANQTDSQMIEDVRR